LAKKKSVEKPTRVLTRRQQSLHKRQQRRQRIIFIAGVSIIAAVILIVLVGWFLGEYRPMNKNIIKVNDTEFNTKYLIDYVKMAQMEMPNETVGGLIDGAVNDIIQSELIRQAAENIGITVTDEDAENLLKNANIPKNDASLDIAETQLLRSRLLDEYIDPMVPVSDNQVNIKAAFVESEEVANIAREQYLSSGNFTAVAEEYGQDYYSKNVNGGDFGWHPRVILKDQISSPIPLDFAFSADIGTLSQPLSDNETYKQMGYWLINVLEKPSETEAVVQAILLSNEKLANDIRPRLEAGDNLSAISDEFTQYSLSKANHGELGLLQRVSNEDGSWKTRVSTDFDEYVYSDNISLGVWSEPVLENTLWTQGGYWLVEVVDREDDRELSEEDRNMLIGNKYDEWLEGLKTISAGASDSTGLTDDIRQRVIEQVSKG
jgi:hypothetical protein